MDSWTGNEIRSLARDCGFELAGIAAAEPASDAPYFQDWVSRGRAGQMRYLTDHRAEIRMDPKRLLPSARTIICVGKLYNGPQAYSVTRTAKELGWISRYAWSSDYHQVLRTGLELLVNQLQRRGNFEYKICVDTAPLLERSYARLAGLGWIGKNTCLINQQNGSWFFLGALLTSLDLEPDTPPPDRCGSCSRCIDACPTQAIVRNPGTGPPWELDATRCISYFTIELRGSIPEPVRAGIGRQVFGCDICQDVCPWNRLAPVTEQFAPLSDLFEAPPLETLAAVSETEFRQMFRPTPMERMRYSGFLRNVAVAMGNSGLSKFRAPLQRMSLSGDAVVAEHARWALDRLSEDP